MVQTRQGPGDCGAHRQEASAQHEVLLRSEGVDRATVLRSCVDALTSSLVSTDGLLFTAIAHPEARHMPTTATAASLLAYLRLQARVDEGHYTVMLCV